MIARCFAWALVGVGLLAANLQAAEVASTPDFKEVQQIIREHLAGATDKTMNQAAVDGLLLALKGRALLGRTNGEAGTNAGVLVSRQNYFGGGIGYVRVGRIAAGLADSVRTAVEQLAATNALTGLVLDLRFAGGDDYAAAAATVDLFLSKEVPLMNAGQGLVHSQEKTNAIRWPVVALVNAETAAGAEALAAMLRQSGAGLVIGGRTAGRAAVMQEFKLSGGQTLRVAVAPVLLGDAKPLPATGMVPDIEVPVKLEDERGFYAEPMMVSGGGITSTNHVRSARRPRVSEADLVREKRGEVDAETLAAARDKAEHETSVLADPVLSRAVDLLKGLAVVRAGRF